MIYKIKNEYLLTCQLNLFFKEPQKRVDLIALELDDRIQYYQRPPQIINLPQNAPIEIPFVSFFKDDKNFQSNFMQFSQKTLSFTITHPYLTSWDEHLIEFKNIATNIITSLNVNINRIGIVGVMGISIDNASNYLYEHILKSPRCFFPKNLKTISEPIFKINILDEYENFSCNNVIQYAAGFINEDINQNQELISYSIDYNNIVNDKLLSKEFMINFLNDKLKTFEKNNCKKVFYYE